MSEACKLKELKLVSPNQTHKLIKMETNKDFWKFNIFSNDILPEI